MDVLPDEATLAAVLSHELAHVVLQHSTGDKFCCSGLTLPFPDIEIFNHQNFHFDAQQEADADKKGLELFAKSPYRRQISEHRSFFSKLSTLRSPGLPNLLHGRLEATTSAAVIS